MRRSAVPGRRGQRDKRPDQPVGTASAASFWWHGPDQELAAEAAPAGFAGAEAAAAAVAVAVAVDLDLRGPSGAAEAADKTRRAPHRDVRRFPRGQDARSENPAGSADPVQSTGRAGGVCVLCARFLCTSKERWLAPSRRESP